MIEQTLKCDIRRRHGSFAKPIHKVRVLVQTQICGLDSPSETSWDDRYTSKPVDMCPDAIERAIKFAERAVTRPNIAATREADAK